MPDAVILCGGAGLRLRSVTGNAPKSMASIGGRPFLELLLCQLRRYGFQRAILAVGYGREAIGRYFGEGKFGLSLVYSPESSPLGTGGALRSAADLVASDAVLVMNGDSYTDADLYRLTVQHSESKADVTVVVAVADGRGDCGSVVVDGDGRLTTFQEKQNESQAPYLNAGIYVMSRHLLDEIPPGKDVSLERELLPGWLRHGKRIGALVCLNRCIDIGTPERYWSAQGALANIEAGPNPVEKESRCRG
jgi:NDP-sugar pyrophosphorylase family protein